MPNAPQTPNPDIDPQESREWLDALDDVLREDGPERARFLLELLGGQAGVAGAGQAITTAYVNTLRTEDEPDYPGNLEIEGKLAALVRWNAMAMVVKANKAEGTIGGHIATYQSIADLWEVAFNHFWRAPTAERGGDLVFFQGHASPGIYARAFLEGRFKESRLMGFRRESDGEDDGLSSYPHAWLMPDFWQFATVSMGLGPLMAIYQARFMKYLDQRGLIDAGDRRVWAFLGDGETDEPESLGALTCAVREGLDNLTFIVNCNLQRLDGPVRGNGKIIQELEGMFRGAGWNVIKLVWDASWDTLLARDTDGLLVARLGELLDGEYQELVTKDGDFIRQKIFGGHPELEKMVADFSDADLQALGRGGHDTKKIYAAFRAATEHRGQPTVILAKTVKGYGMGAVGEGQNPTHGLKKLKQDDVLYFRDRFQVPLDDDQASKLKFLKPPADSPEMVYLEQRRQALGGHFPVRVDHSANLEIPALAAFKSLLEGSGERQISTTLAFVRILSLLTRDANLKKHLVPILADEARTFGMEGMFRQLGIYAHQGQLYTPVDAHQLAYYREDAAGQILQEGINEGGAIASWIAAGMSYSTHGVPMIPFFIFYSMFGFQRIGDFIWAAADQRARGFLIGGTSGRTTLNGEGLQHQDGHSHLIAATVPTCVSYDPTYGYELAVIVQDGLQRMYGEGEDVFYYITTLNENYPQPAMPSGAEGGIRRGMYLLSENKRGSKKPRVQLLGCGAILREVIAAAELLEKDFDVLADVWSVPSFNELARDGRGAERYNLLHPEGEQRSCWVAQCLSERSGPVIAATDYQRAFSEQIRPWVPAPYSTLGTDGFGRSDTREQLRRFFEVDRYFVAVAALRALATAGEIDPKAVTKALAHYQIDSAKPDPATV